MKIAVAVESKEMQVAKRMGHAPWFTIYKLDGDNFSLLEMAVNEHAREHHGEADHNHHAKSNENEIEHHRQHLGPLKGVDAMLTRAVGPHMKEALSREGINIYRIPLKAGKLAPDLINYFISNRDEVETLSP